MTPSAIAYLVALGVVIPALAYISKREMDKGLVVPRLPFYAEAIVLQVMLLGASFYVASLNRIIVFRRFAARPSDLLLALALFLFAFGAMLIGWRFTRPETRKRLALLIPTTSSERFVWAALSLAAAVAEEVAYRGVLVTLLQRSLRVWWTAVIISSILFALAHLLQGWRSAAIVGVFAILFHLLVRATGSLYAAIAVHFAYDLAAGFTLGRLLAREESHDQAV